MARPTPPPKHNPAPLIECWAPNISCRFRSDCSTTELASDSDFPSARDTSGGRPADGSCTAPSCSVKFDDFGVGARLRRQIQQEEGTQSLHASFVHLSLPQNISVGDTKVLQEATHAEDEQVSDAVTNEAFRARQHTSSPNKWETNTYGIKDLLRHFCFMGLVLLLASVQRRQGQLSRPEAFVCFKRATAAEGPFDTLEKPSAGVFHRQSPQAEQQRQQQQDDSPGTTKSHIASDKQEQALVQRPQQQLWRQQRPFAINSNSSGSSSIRAGEPCGEEQRQEQQLHQDSEHDIQQKHYVANIEAVPVLQKAQKLRQLDIAITVYDSFKRKGIAFRPNVFTLLVHCALGSRDFERAIEWLLEFLNSGMFVEAAWLDRIIAATAVGAPHLLQSLLQQLQQLQQNGKLGEDCCYVVRSAAGYVALTAAAAGLQMGTTTPNSASPPQRQQMQHQSAWTSGNSDSQSPATAAATAAARVAVTAAERAQSRSMAAAEAEADVRRAAEEVAERERWAAAAEETAIAEEAAGAAAAAAAAETQGQEAAAAAIAAAVDDSPSKKLNPNAPEFIPVFGLTLQQQQQQQRQQQYYQRQLMRQHQHQQQQQRHDLSQKRGAGWASTPPSAAAGTAEQLKLLEPEAAAERLQQEIEALQSSSEQHPQEQQMLHQLQEQLLLLVQQHQQKQTLSPASAVVQTPSQRHQQRMQQMQQQLSGGWRSARLNEVNMQQQRQQRQHNSSAPSSRMKIAQALITSLSGGSSSPTSPGLVANSQKHSQQQPREHASQSCG